MLTIYQKKTCVTCQKALAYLNQQGITYQAVDIEKQLPPQALLESVIDPENIKASLNTRSAIYKAKGLGEPGKKLSLSQVLGLIQADPNLIKRPLIVQGKKALLGFEPEAIERLLK